MKNDIVTQISSKHDILKLLVHRSQRVSIKDKKTLKKPKNYFTPLPYKHKVSKSPNSPESPKSPREYSPPPPPFKFPSLKSPITINSVEFPINYYDQLANLVLPEVRKSAKRPTFNSVNPRVSNELKSHKLSEAGVIEFRPDFPQVRSKPCLVRHKAKNTTDFSSNVDFKAELTEKFRKLLPAYQPNPEEAANGKNFLIKTDRTGENEKSEYNRGVKRQGLCMNNEKKLVSVGVDTGNHDEKDRGKERKTTRLQKFVKEVIEVDESVLQGWSFNDYENN